MDSNLSFTNPGTPNYARDIHLADNLGGLRFYGASSLKNPADGAAIQFFGNGHTQFPGQAFIDAGSHNSAAIIFRTGLTGQVVTERLRVAANGNVGINQPSPAAKLDVTGDINTSTQFMIGGSRVLSASGSNTSAGIGAGATTSAGNNSFFGKGAGQANQGDFNSFFGSQAGQANTQEFANTFIGFQAGMVNGQGDQSLNANQNTFVGSQAGLGNTTGARNAFLGNRAGQTNQTGSDNTVIGGFADVGGINLTNATAIGANAKAMQSNSTAIGANALVTQPNSLVLGGISGFNGGTDTNVGFGTPTPAARLHVAGGDLLFENKWRTETTTVTPGPVPGPPNLIGGFLGTGGGGAAPGNRVTAGVVGAAIGGGGFNGTINFPSSNTTFTGDRSNRVTDWFGTVGGGYGNRAGNDDATPDNASFATVGGGNVNTASGIYSTVSGGTGNFASGVGSTVPGGQSNAAAGDFSFAAGRGAGANHQGAFVWADSTGGAFASTANDQFLIRAAGGVGIGTNAPLSKLDVRGDLFVGLSGVPDFGAMGNSLFVANDSGDSHNSFRIDGFQNDLAIIARSGASSAAGASISFRTGTAAAGETDRVRIQPDGSVGIGTTTPGAQLSLGQTLSNIKLALYDNNTSDKYGLGIQSLQFRFHLGNNGARYSFYDDSAGTNELMTIQGAGNVVIGSLGKGIILKSPDGTKCRLLTIDNTGALTPSAIACP